MTLSCAAGMSARDVAVAAVIIESELQLLVDCCEMYRFWLAELHLLLKFG